jgi:ferric-dicitrate binding protein FerR (iron transport regulator)
MDDVVDHHRADRHRRAYQDAERLENTAYSIPSGKNMAENPYEGNRRGGKRRVGTYGSANKAVLGSGKPQLFQKKRRPSWK